MKVKLIVLSLLLLAGCSTRNQNNSIVDNVSACKDFEDHVKEKYLKRHDGMCLIKKGFNEGTNLLIKEIALPWPVLDRNGAPCDKEDCPIFVVLSWDKDASIGVIVSENIFTNGGFDGEDIENTLAYLREKTGVKFRRNN